MRVPAIVPVLTGQSPLTVRLVVQDIVRRMASLPEREQWRTALWLTSKALQWLHFNAAGFIDAGSAGEGAQRRLFRTVWAVARHGLLHNTVEELQRFSRATAATTRWPEQFASVLSHCHQVSPAQLAPRMKATTDLWYNAAHDASMTDHQRDVWRTLFVAASFDLVAANPHALPECGAHFVDTVRSKWAEVCKDWPFFQQAYPMEVLIRAP